MTDEEKAAAAKAAQDKAIGDAVSAAVKAALPAAITAAVGPAVTEAIKPLAEQLRAPAAGTGGAGEDGKPKSITMEDLTRTLDERDKRQQTARDQSAAREQFIAGNLAKLPKAYQQQLGSDPARWADEAKTIQASFEGDFKGLGGKPETLGGANREGGTTAAQQPVDISKMNPVQKIAYGLKQGVMNAAGGAGAAGAAGAQQQQQGTAATAAAK